MRWNKKPKPVEGDIREVRKFLFFPRTFKDKDHVRWFEFAVIREKYKFNSFTYGYNWVEIDFVNE